MGRVPSLLFLILAVTCQFAAAVRGQVADSLMLKQQRRIEVLEKISPTVVCVMPPGGQGGGSGVLISADGFAISNYHVTSGSGDFMKCGLNDGQVYDAVIVGIDPTGDVALIKLLGRDDFPYCAPGNSDLVEAGDEVLALGNPFLLASDFTPTVTYGIVSGVQRYQYPAGSYLEYTDCIQIDASINPGNSGGPLFDIEGRWIGINGRASFEKRGRINSGAAYAISVRQVLMFVEQLKSGRIVDHGKTDFTVATAPGGVVEVQEVSQISEARRRGMVPGDELVSFAGRSISSANDFKNILGIFPAGTRVPFKYRSRDGIRRGTVRLQPLHEFETAPPIPGGPPTPPVPGKPGDEDPDGEDSDGQSAEEQGPKPPPQYAHLFEEKKPFANYYFNRTFLEETLAPLKALLPAASGNAPSTWVVRLKHPNPQIKTVGELLVSETAAGLLGDQWQVKHQRLDGIDATNEPEDFYGLLSGSLNWFHVFQNDWDRFSDVVYHGVEELITEGVAIRVVIIKDAERTARWYFKDAEKLPWGLDLAFSAGADESRLRFQNWNTEASVPWPGRIGLVDSDSEQVTWLAVESFEVKVNKRKSQTSDSRKKVKP